MALGFTFRTHRRGECAEISGIANSQFSEKGVFLV